VPVPADPSQVIYVWFDALINYITGVGFPDNKKRFETHWPADIHVIGKDITRFHCVIWPAMLMSAGLPLPKVVFGHGFVYIGGKKMSKTTGTLVDPLEIVKKVGTDSLRYFLMREIAFDRDGDFYPEKFVTRHNSELANDLGNLVLRTVSMVNKYQDGFVKKSLQSHPKDAELKEKLLNLADVAGNFIDRFEFHNALSAIWERIRLINAYIDQTAPWGLYKSSQNQMLANVLKNCIEGIKIITIVLYPFIPSSCEKIWKAIGLEQKIPLSKINIDVAKNMDFVSEDTKVVLGEPVFPRIKCL
jgi:methionyl-tRNA synthetase